MRFVIPSAAKELVHAFERASDRSLPCTMADRRPGDIAACWADATRAAEVLGWRTQRDLDAMCRGLVLATGQPRRLRQLNSDVSPHGALICLTPSRTARPFFLTSSRTARRAEPVRHPGRPAGPSRDPDGRYVNACGAHVDSARSKPLQPSRWIPGSACGGPGMTSKANVLPAGTPLS